ncbi:MAG: hypothetical protein HQL20_08375 [Candidatus Omnitrophica bacterium]|nr:hypothetical protein [Candidatus Omnitrophota bacterium]
MSFQYTDYFENEVLRKRPYLKKEWCVSVVENPLHAEIQDDNRYRFWGQVPQVPDKFLRVVTLEDKRTIHNAFFDRGFKI